jgi:RNA binding exosome subunit
MNATGVHEQITEHLLDKVEESKWLHVQLMNRIESRIKTRDELERYLTILVGKLEQTEFRSEALLDRIDRIVNLLERFDRQQSR